MDLRPYRPRSRQGRRLLGAARTVRKALRRGQTLGEIARRHGVAYCTLRKLILSWMSPAQFARMARASLRRSGRRCARLTGFRPGQVPWNKGRKGIHLSPATEFRRGTMYGPALRNWVVVGTIRIRVDKSPRSTRDRKRRRGAGERTRRRWIKVRDDGPPRHRWRPYARWLWELTYGPLAPGLYVHHRSGDCLDDRLANLSAVTPAEHVRLQWKNSRAFREKQARHARGMALDRWARYRAAKEKGMDPSRRQRWECPECGGSSDGPGRCTHCGNTALERVGPPVREPLSQSPVPSPR
jgi:hypothetical protein